jgi:multidrug resistance efflux pump
VIAKKNLGDAELKAPFSGVVSSVPGGPGTVVTADCQPKPLVILQP